MEGNLVYATTDFDQASGLTDASESYVNIPRDLSMTNRKGFAMTSSKGVPLVYHCRVTFFRPPSATNIDTYIAVGGAQSNWVTRNASVKLHHAREAMYRNAGIKKSDRSRYDKTLRLNYNAASQTWLLPGMVDSSGAYDTTGADWDPSKIAIDDDISLIPTLFGGNTNEESTVSAATFNIQNAYLASRRKVAIEDVSDAEDVAARSILRQMFEDDPDRQDEIAAIAHEVGDEPPYNSDAVAGTYTSVSTLGIGVLGNLSAVSYTMDIDVPFGLFYVLMNKTSLSGNLVVKQVPFHVQVLGISEMQG